ncbi:MAG: transcription antitermination factor NusB [Coriobacteriia bacterium]|nr:transcription antitermination factor NusB [Coriobacteriia bacterium]
MGEEIVLEGLGVAPSVLETIATLAAEGVEGVEAVLTRPVAGLVAKTASRGVSVEIGDDGALAVQVHLEVRYGRPLRQVAEDVKAAIADAMRAQTGHEVGSVDVYIDGIVFPEQDSDRAVMAVLERTRARRQALQILYQREITGESCAQILAQGTYALEGEDPAEYCKQIVLGVEANQPQIDEEIERTSEHWSLTRMPIVDRNILRIAVYEILFEGQVPNSVAINEAVELGKVFGGDDSSKFINGVLGRIAERQEASTVQPTEDVRE